MCPKLSRFGFYWSLMIIANIFMLRTIPQLRLSSEIDHFDEKINPNLPKSPSEGSQNHQKIF